MSNRSEISEHECSSATRGSSGRVSKRRRILNLANELLVITGRPLIDSLWQIGPHMYVEFYEKICSMQLVDKKWPPSSDDDHVHNTQAVVDSLSLDVLHEDLSYLTGEAVCRPHWTSVEYLLEILKSVHEWINASSNRKHASNCSSAQQNISLVRLG